MNALGPYALPLRPVEPLEMDVSTAAPVAGAPGRLEMLPVARLRIDSRYQRPVSARGKANIKRIALNFDWAKFLPLIAVPEGGGFAVVDGQHRAIAAATLGIERVPAYVHELDGPAAAGAFAAINGSVVRISPADLYLAQLASGDPEALALQRVLDCAGVRVVSLKRHDFEVGETRAVNVLRRALRTYGADLLTTVLQCITETGDGNPGLIIGAVVNGVARAIEKKADLLAEPSRLFDLFDQIDLRHEFEAARHEFAVTRNPAQQVLTRRLNAELKRLMEKADG